MNERSIYDVAAEMAVRAAAASLGALTPEDAAQLQGSRSPEGLYLMALLLPKTNALDGSVPTLRNGATPREVKLFIGQTLDWSHKHLLGEFRPADVERVVEHIGLRLSQIAPLKARWLAASFNVLDLATMLATSRSDGLIPLQPGALRSFGATKFFDDRLKRNVIVAATGCHPILDRLATELYPEMLHALRAMSGDDPAYVARSDEFLVTRSSMLAAVPAWVSVQV